MPGKAVAARRKFGGKVYSFHSYHLTKKEASDEATRLRSRGFSVRVTPRLADRRYRYYEVWKRKARNK